MSDRHFSCFSRTVGEFVVICPHSLRSSPEVINMHDQGQEFIFGHETKQNTLALSLRLTEGQKQ